MTINRMMGGMPVTFTVLRQLDDAAFAAVQPLVDALGRAGVPVNR